MINLLMQNNIKLFTFHDIDKSI